MRRHLRIGLFLALAVYPRWSCAEIIIDSFTSGDFELTQEDMRQTNTNSLSDLAIDLPDVASGRRFTGIGNFAQSIFTNPAANVRLAI